LEELDDYALVGNSVVSFLYGSKLRVLGLTWVPCSLSFIEVSPDNPYFAATPDGVMFSKDLKTLIMYPPNRTAIDYTLPSGVEVIDDYAFMHVLEYEYCDVTCALTSITFPSSLREVGDRALAHCLNLADLTLPDSLERIGFCAFGGCNNLHVISFGSHLSEVCGDWPLSIESFHVSADNPFFSSDSSGVLWSKDFSRLILYPPGRASTHYDVPQSTQIIGNNAFLACSDYFSMAAAATSVGYCD
jgi:hypothetical protein